MGAAKKRKAPVHHGDVRLQILELLTAKSMSIDEICEAKAWDRHVADYALTSLRKDMKLVRDEKHVMQPRADGKGHKKVMILEVVPNALETYKAIKAGQTVSTITPPEVNVVAAVTTLPAPAVRAGNVQVVSDIHEYERLVLQKAKIEMKIEVLRGRLFPA